VDSRALAPQPAPAAWPSSPGRPSQAPIFVIARSAAASAPAAWFPPLVRQAV